MAVQLLKEGNHANTPFKTYIVDTLAELTDLKGELGTQAFCLEDGNKYAIKTNGTWATIKNGEGGGESSPEFSLEVFINGTSQGVYKFNYSDASNWGHYYYNSPIIDSSGNRLFVAANGPYLAYINSSNRVKLNGADIYFGDTIDPTATYTVEIGGNA